MRRSRHRPPPRLVLAFGIALLVTGCVNLEPVREFASISTEAAAYRALVDAYVEVPRQSAR